MAEAETSDICYQSSYSWKKFSLNKKKWKERKKDVKIFYQLNISKWAACFSPLQFHTPIFEHWTAVWCLVQFNTCFDSWFSRHYHTKYSVKWLNVTMYNKCYLICIIENVLKVPEAQSWEETTSAKQMTKLLHWLFLYILKIDAPTSNTLMLQYNFI